MATAVAHEPLQVVLPSSIRILVPATFDAPALGRLLDVLEHHYDGRQREFRGFESATDDARGRRE